MRQLMRKKNQFIVLKTHTLPRSNLSIYFCLHEIRTSVSIPPVHTYYSRVHIVIFATYKRYVPTYFSTQLRQRRANGH